METNWNQRTGRTLLLALVLWAGSTFVVKAKDSVLQTEANVMIEVTFIATRVYADPFNEVTLDVRFIDPKGRELRVPAFWAGTNLWKVRYASPVVGRHRFGTECSKVDDKGLHGVAGQVEVKPYQGSNPLYTHGPLQLSANRRFMEHKDGKPFFWLGDTWWMGLCHRLRWPEDVQKLAADRKEKGFNVIQIVAGLYPDMHPFDPRGANEAGYPWETNYTRIRPEYFNAADQRIQYLVDQGFTPCIVGAWGYFIPWMGVEKANQHWRNLVARYGALPVVWCVAGEANLPWYLAKGFPWDDRKQIKDWTEVTRYLRQLDPFHRLITIHPTGIGRLSARNAIDDLSLIDIDMLQTPHGQRDAVAPTIRTVRECYADKPVMPVINGEASYEMLSDNLPTQWTRQMFWLCLMNGAAGHTYGANGIWQVNRKGQSHGPSPHHNGGHGYGQIPWDEAMNLPGSRQVAFGKKLFEQFPWQRFTPHPEWAEFLRESTTLSLDDSQWIWFAEGNPAQDAPAEKRFLRKSFVIPAGKTIASASLLVTGDDFASAALNSVKLGSVPDWKNPRQFNNLAEHLKEGSNVLAMTVQNGPAPAPNPAGFLCVLEIKFTNGDLLKVVSDATWQASKAETAGWESANFNDPAWSPAIAMGKYGAAPWGKFGGQSELEAPQAAGIPDVVRMIYVPLAQSIKVRQLDAKKDYTATYFDPSSGEKTSAGIIRSDESGSWSCPPPASLKEQDWVVILEAKK